MNRDREMPTFTYAIENSAIKTLSRILFYNEHLGFQHDGEVLLVGYDENEIPTYQYAEAYDAGALLNDTSSGQTDTRDSEGST